MNRLSNEKGFTYLEIMISFAIFALVLVIIIRISGSINDLVRYAEEQNQMLYIADISLENYKSGIDDMPVFISQTNYIILSENQDVDGNFLNRIIQDQSLDGKYNILITELMVTPDLKDITVTVSRNNYPEYGDITLYSKILKNSE